MEDVKRFKEEAKDLWFWYHVLRGPEKSEKQYLIERAKKYLAENWPTTIPPGEYYKSSGKMIKVPEGHYYFTREKKLKKITREGSRETMRTGCHSTKIVVVE